MEGYTYPSRQEGDKGEHMITHDENFSKWASASPASPVPTSKHPVGVEGVTPQPLSGAQESLPLSDLPQPPVSPVLMSKYEQLTNGGKL